MNIKRIVKLFEINPNKLVSREDKGRWIGVLRELEQCDEESIKRVLKSLVDFVGPEKPKLYYLEAVRRKLRDEKHLELKKMEIAPSIKMIMKDIVGKL